MNLLWLVPGEVGGSEEYTVRLLGALADLAPDDLEITLYVTARTVDAHGALTDRYRSIVAPVSGGSRPVRVAAESSWLAARALRDRVAVVHHAGGTMPFVRSVPGIVTLHDLQPLSNPERFGLVKRTYIRALAPRSLRAARAVICLTEFTAADAEHRAGVPAERIRLVPSGVDDPGPGPDPLVQESVLDRYGLTGTRFVLYPAITYAHKNHETLVAAFARVARDRPDVRLVLTGSPGPYEGLVRSAITAYGLDDAVVRPGRIPEADLDVLYRRASVLAFPSRYEGFGLPVLEAMARGCPVVASRVAALPGVTGGAAELIEPLDVADWAQALANLLDDAGRRTVLARRGVERSHHFRWPDAATALAAVYRDVVGLSSLRLSEETG